jgi:hypothetical protein
VSFTGLGQGLAIVSEACPRRALLPFRTRLRASIKTHQPELPLLRWFTTFWRHYAVLLLHNQLSRLSQLARPLMDTFRFRLNCIDHYQATPTELDPQLRHGSEPSQRHNAPPVPVIRVFGATETGQKVCAHIHGALPYMFLEYDGGLDREAGL